MADQPQPTHVAYVKKRLGKTHFVWLEIGRGRLDDQGAFHGFLDRMPIGGFTGYLYFARLGEEPPALAPERPDKANDEPGEF
jgi:hypothetical protein